MGVYPFSGLAQPAPSVKRGKQNQPNALSVFIAHFFRRTSMHSVFFYSLFTHTGVFSEWVALDHAPSASQQNAKSCLYLHVWCKLG